MSIFPQQRLSHSKKIAQDFRWAKECVDYIAARAYRDKSYEMSLKSNYDLYLSRVNQEDFRKECNPFGLSGAYAEDEIKPYNKVFTKVNALLGELLTRPTSYRVMLTDRNSVSKKLEAKKQMLLDFLLGISDMDPAQIEEYSSKTYLDSREILASKLLHYYQKKLDAKALSLEGFRHALISGYEVYYLDYDGQDVFIEVVDPREFYFAASHASSRIEDAVWACRRTYRSLSYILDVYGDELKKSELEELQDSFIASEEALLDRQISPEHIVVEHVQWLSQREVYFVVITDQTGVYEEVFTEFEIPANAAKVKKDGDTYWEFAVGDVHYVASKRWVNEVWQGTRIAYKYYVNLGPRPFSLGESILGDDKLSYFGLVYNLGSGLPVSLVERMKPFQYLYLLVMHKLKKLISQDFGKIFPFDITMLDPKVGLEKTLYYLRELGIDIYNPLQNADQPGWSQRGKVSHAIDLSNAQHIVNYLQVLSILDQQIGEVAGINRQREGFIAPQEAVTNAQQNTYLSSVITMSLFYAHDKLWERLLSALLNLVKQLDASVYAATVLDEDTNLMMTLSGAEGLSDASIGVFITSSAADQLLFDQLKQSALVLFNNRQLTPADYIHIMSSSSVAEIKARLEAIERQQQALQQQAEENRYKLEQQLKNEEFEQRMAIEQLKADTAIRVAEISSFRYLENQDINANTVPDQLEIERLRYDQEYRARKLDLEERKIELKEKEQEQKDGRKD